MSHKMRPTTNSIKVPSDRSPAERDCQVFTACGKKANVVQLPAIIPNTSSQLIGRIKSNPPPLASY